MTPKRRRVAKDDRRRTAGSSRNRERSPARSGPRRLLLGPHAVAEALANKNPVDALFVDVNARAASEALLTEARDAGVAVDVRTAPELDQITDGHKHQGLVGVAGAFPYQSLDDLLEMPRQSIPPLFVALDEITDPQNFGAIVRSASALGAAAVITLKQRAAPVTAAAVRASAGATERLPIARVTNLAETLAQLRKLEYQVVGLAGDGDIVLDTLGPPPDAGRVLVVGSEGRGLRRLVRERCNLVARIDLPGPVASLNASVATAIALYEVTRVQSDGR